MTNDKPDGDQSLLVRVIAWLVPSATTLLVIAGFVASTAHFAFLGFDPGFLGATVYSGITGEFLRDIASVVLDLPRGWGTLLMDFPRSVFLATCLLVLVSLGWRRVREIVLGNECDRAFILIPLLLLIVLVKFVLMDGPLMRVESVLVSISEPSQSDTVRTDSGLKIEQRLQPRENERFIGRYTTARASDLWRDMKCSRLNRKPECKRSEEDSFLSVRAEFLAHLLAAVFVGFIVSCIVRHTKRPIVVAAALLSALSCLTLPYAYGKLVRSTHYPYGVLLIDHGGEGATRDHQYLPRRSALKLCLPLLGMGPTVGSTRSCQRQTTHLSATSERVSVRSA